MKHPKFELKKTKNGDFYFNLTAGNGQVIASSQMYKSKVSAKKGIKCVQANVAVAVIERCEL